MLKHIKQVMQKKSLHAAKNAPNPSVLLVDDEAPLLRALRRDMADHLGRELDAGDIWDAFQSAYHLGDNAKPFQLVDYEENRAADGTRIFVGKIAVEGGEQSVSGRGNGLISSVVSTLEGAFDLDIKVLDYSEHALGSGRNARAAAYLMCQSGERLIWGCGIDEDVATASVRAVLSAANSAVAC